MIGEKELIGKIKELRQVKPNKDWVLLTKTRILGEEPRFEESYFWVNRLAYAGVFSILMLFGLLVLARDALPGDPLYLVKRAVEKTQMALASDNDKPKVQFEFANKRLEELNQIAQGNEAKKLAPAISEFKTDVAVVAKNLSRTKKVNKDILVQVQRLEENKQKVEKVLSAKIDTAEYDDAIALIVENEIKDLGNRTLNESGKEILNKAKEDYQAGNYSDALIKIINLSQTGY